MVTVGEKRSKRTKAILAATALLVVLAALVSAAFFLNQTSTKPPKQEADVLAIGIKYVAEKYGTDYFVNSVGPVTYSEMGPNGPVAYDYPTATFRVPADMQKPGLLVYVMVNPQTGEIVRTFTSWSKSLPPPIPTALAEASPIIC